MTPKVVEIRNIIEGKVERVELSREAAAHLISAMYAAFASMKLTGPTTARTRFKDGARRSSDTDSLGGE